jgi:hypothetical protein
LSPSRLIRYPKEMYKRVQCGDPFAPTPVDATRTVTYESHASQIEFALFLSNRKSRLVLERLVVFCSAVLNFPNGFPVVSALV